MKVYRDLGQVFTKVLSPRMVKKLSKETGFVKRSCGRLSVFELLLSLTLGSVNCGGNSLSSIIVNMKSSISREALHQRFRKEASDFFKACLERTIRITSEHSPVSRFKSLNGFGRVCVWDSSGWRLNERLSNDLPGNGGSSATNAGCKLQFCYDMKSYSIVHSELTNGITPDQRYSKEQIAVNTKKKT